jgi:glycine/D-amino acid oxidase-like deaminating enzyme
MSGQHPILIVGGGLAGTALAWRLWERDEPFVVADPGHENTCSRIAAGLITPITGLRLTVSPGFADQLAAAREFYGKVGQELGGNFYHELPHVRLFKDARELKHWRARASAPGFREWLDPEAPDPLVDEQSFHGELGGIQQRGSGWLDTAGYLAASQSFFKQRGRWQGDLVDENTLEPNADGVRWRGDVYRCVVLCRGADERAQARFFPWLPWQCARGVVATVKADLEEKRIVARNCWLLPREGAWRAGSTYDWDLTAPIEPSIEALREKLAGLLRVPFEMVETQAGVRPILRERSAALGRHPAHPNVAVFNGLGSKGALQAPLLARMLADHLLEGAPLDDALDVAANG